MIKKYFFQAPNHRILLSQCFLFAILFGVWVLQNNAHIKNTCLVLGALLSIPAIYQNRQLLLTKAALPIWLLGLLFLWVSFHLVFLSHNYPRQLWEYISIWKHIFLGFIFALGLGFGIGNSVGDVKRTKQYWAIIYFGLALPTLIYFFRFALGYGATRWGIIVPPEILLNRDNIFATNWIMKASYVFFCLPVFAVSLGRIFQLMQDGRLSWWSSALYFSVMFLVLEIFYLENARNGLGWAGILVCIFIALSLLKIFRQYPLRAALIIGLLAIIISSFGFLQLKQNPQWNTLLVDLQLARQIDQDTTQAWKGFERAPPINSNGVVASVSNYQRGVWAIVGLRLIKEYPQGYGLLMTSFREISRTKWPESNLSQSHSAWIDFTLSEGIIGGLLLFVASIMTAWNSRKLSAPWPALGIWGVLSIILLFLTTEVSSRFYIDAFIYLITLSSALGAIQGERSLNK